MSEYLVDHAKINSQGSILMGNHTVVDGYQHGREIGILTHIHTDHTNRFTQALHECSQIYMSPPTFDLLAALQNEDYNVSQKTILEGRHMHRLDFGKPFRPKRYIRDQAPERSYADRITLFQAQHILGSAQVLVETNEGTKIVYSSDFAYPDTEPIKCDVLILDSTHGSPRFSALVDAPSLENRLIEYIDEEIQSGNSITIRSHIGRLQYIMSLLSKKFKDIPFLTNDKNLRLSKVYNKYGFYIKEMMQNDTLKSQELMSGSALFIEFKTIPEAKSIAEFENRTAVFSLGGFFLGNKTTIRALGNKQYQLELDDHANYSQIINYVKECNPKLVITDSYRSKKCKELANSITQELGIDATHQPQ